MLGIGSALVELPFNLLQNAVGQHGLELVVQGLPARGGAR
jgi:hypothetical protein